MKVAVNDIKYIPVLRYRQQEKAALKILISSFSSKILPFIEIIKETPNARLSGSFQTIYTKEIAELKKPLLIDFPMYLPLVNATDTQVSRFLRPIQNNPVIRMDYFQKLAPLKGQIIPVASYNPQIPYTTGTITNEANFLRSLFGPIAFRIFVSGFSGAITEVQSLIANGDILILDIDDAPYSNSGFSSLYTNISQIIAGKIVATVLMTSAIDRTITNIGLIDDQVIPNADNSLLTAYHRHGFSAFGDYAGIKKDQLTAGGTISPGFIFYSYHNNCFIGYSGITRALSEFETHIAPAVMRSSYWRAYSLTHHSMCPGCKTIQNVVSATESGKNQAKWKGISLQHYLYTMQEFL